MCFCELRTSSLELLPRKPNGKKTQNQEQKGVLCVLLRLNSPKRCFTKAKQKIICLKQNKALPARRLVGRFNPENQTFPSAPALLDLALLAKAYVKMNKPRGLC